MTQKYTIEKGTAVKLGETRLQIMHGERRLAYVDFAGRKVSMLIGKPDKAFTKEHGISPVVELLMHVAHRFKQKDGTATLFFHALTPDAQRVARRFARNNSIELHDFMVKIRKIELHVPPHEEKPWWRFWKK